MKPIVPLLFAALGTLMGLSVSRAQAAAVLSEKKLAQIVQRPNVRARFHLLKSCRRRLLRCSN
jgi:hypothetical protein